MNIDETYQNDDKILEEGPNGESLQDEDVVNLETKDESQENSPDIQKGLSKNPIQNFETHTADDLEEEEDDDDEVKITDELANEENQNSIGKQTEVRQYLNSKMINRKEKLEQEESQPDYGNPTFENELLDLIQKMNSLSITEDEGVVRSLRLIVRRGHRRRLTDLIGSDPLSPDSSRKALTENTSIFDKTRVDSRDYASNPVATRQALDPNEKCDLPCKYCISNCDTSFELVSMENSPHFLGRFTTKAKYNVYSSTRLNSDIPLPYFSWHDFGIMRKVTQPKKSFAAAFISNCGFSKRNDFLRNLIKIFGPEEIHSFGRCINTKTENVLRSQQGKLEQLESYFYSLAFENSETTDYVTEKFFGSLASGSIPVYIGAPNIKFFAPDVQDYPYESDAVIRVSDFNDDVHRVSEVMKDLKENPKLYSQMLRWKEVGYSDDFKAFGDLSSTHSSCRTCSYIADERRFYLGPNQYDLRVLKTPEHRNGDGNVFYVRERGMYSFYEIYLPQLDFIEFIRKILKYIPQKPINLWKDNEDLRPFRSVKRVYGIYSVRSKRPVLHEEDLKALPNNAELEVIFI